MWRLSDVNSLSDTRLKLLLGYLFGCSLGLSLFALALVIGLGKVEEHTSFGLPFVLGGLTTLAGGFTHWAFGETIKIDSNGAPPAIPPPTAPTPPK